MLVDAEQLMKGYKEGELLLLVYLSPFHCVFLAHNH